MRSRTRPFNAALTLGLALAIGLAAAAAAAPGDKVWQATFNGPGLTDFGGYITRSRDGASVFVIGSGKPDLTDPGDVVTIAYNASTGAQRWVKRIVGPVTDGYEQPGGIVASPTADLVFVTARVTSAANDSNWRTTAYAAATGAVVWQRGFDGAAHDDDGPYAIAVGPGGGRIYVTGYEQDAVGSYARTIAYDAATGATTWSRRIGAAGTYGFGGSLAVSPDGGRVLVAGGVNDGSGQRAFVTALQAGAGTVQWTRVIGPAPALPPGEIPNDSFQSVGVSPDGTRVFASGSAKTSSSTSAILVASLAAATGTPQWTVRRGGSAPGYAQANALSIGPGGARIFVTGSDPTASDGIDWIVLSYRVSDGGTAWVRNFGGTAKQNDTTLASAIRPDGTRLFVTGSVRNTGTGRDGRTVALNPVDGTTVWNRLEDGAAHLTDWLGAIAVGPSGGRVYVTGSTQTGPFLSPTAALTVAYTS